MAEPEFVPSGFFALRTPLLPFDELLEWSAGLSAVQSGEDTRALEAACAADKLLLRQRLREAVGRPEFREALYVASPDLDDRLHAWEGDPESEAGQKIERALVRYFARMAGRATPFGLFAGCSVGNLGSETKMVLAERSTYRRHTRLDMDYVVALAQALSRDKAVQAGVALHPNSSLYTTPDRVCYAEVRRNGKGWTHHNITLAQSGYLEATLARARCGALSATLAAGLIEADPDATLEEAQEYIADLIDNQVLVSELIPPLTGPEPIHDMAVRLSEPAADGAGDRLHQTRSALESLDAGGIGASPERYREIARTLQELPAKLEPGRMVQVDMVKPAVEATLGKNVVDEIVAGVAMLQRLSRRPPNDVLARFREKFAGRYEGREVPLVEALDPEIGIGFDAAIGGEADTSSLLDGLEFPKTADETAAWGKRERTLLHLLSEALTRGLKEVELRPRDVEEMSLPDRLPLPDAFGVMGTIAAASQAAIAQGDFRLLLEAVSGPSGARLLGRFCHADPALEAHVQAHLCAEEALQPDAVFAEIVHLPESRLGNILARPVLRNFEIPYLGRPGVDTDRQIPVSDLHVSVVGDEIVLRSERLGRRVIPRLTSAHNFNVSQGIYKFLCLLQGHGTAEGLGWDWGPLRHAPELPRVVCGRLVLARASWRLSREELKSLGDTKGAARFRAMQKLRVERRLPRWVSLADGDNELPVDLDNVMAVNTLIELVKAREEAMLLEVYPGPDQLLATGPEGRFVHEFVVPFVRAMPGKLLLPENDLGPRPAGKSRQSLDASAFPGRAWERESPCPPHPRPLCQGERGDLVGWVERSEAHHSGGQRGQWVEQSEAHDAARRWASHGSTHPTSGGHLRRSFPPGSEWLYVKLYTGQATADRLLRELVRPVAESACSTDAADDWFFIRYGDPDWHLRVRFHGDARRLHADIFPQLEAAADPFLADGRIWRMQLDTYEREIERYGGDAGIQLAEQFFHADSLAALDLLAIAGDARSALRWQMAVCSIDRLLADLGLDLDAKRALMKQSSTAFAAEFDADAKLQKQISEKFRNERKALESLLEVSHEDAGTPSAIAAILCRRSERSKPIKAAFDVLEQEGRLQRPLTDLAASFVHMHVNRLLVSAHRAHELVIYDFLRRLYESQIARR